MSRLTAEQEGAIRARANGRFRDQEPEDASEAFDDRAALLDELTAVRAERDAARALTCRMSAAVHGIGVAALNWNSTTRVTDVLEAVETARKVAEKE